MKPIALPPSVVRELPRTARIQFVESAAHVEAHVEPESASADEWASLIRILESEGIDLAEATRAEILALPKVREARRLIEAHDTIFAAACDISAYELESPDLDECERLLREALSAVEIARAAEQELSDDD